MTPDEQGVALTWGSRRRIPLCELGLQVHFNACLDWGDVLFDVAFSECTLKIDGGVAFMALSLQRNELALAGPTPVPAAC